jgi:4,5-dihydroxyphthalate decarboxylase
VYGLKGANRKNLETAVRYTHQQGLISRALPLEELFIDAGDQQFAETVRT